MTVHERLRAARQRTKKRQVDIASEIGCTQASVADWETGRALPRTEMVRAVAKAYGLRPELLLPESAA